MQRLGVAFTPRLSFLMRGASQPVNPPPVYKVIVPAARPRIRRGVAGYDLEYGASMQPRANPAFNDLWVVGATGGANRVIPQGIDYSRDPCCTTGLAGAEVSPLVVGLIGIPLVLLAFNWLFGSYSYSRRSRNQCRYEEQALWELEHPREMTAE